MAGLTPQVSLPVGLAVAAVVYGIYTNMTPTLAEIRHQDPQDPNIASSRKAATWTAAAVVGGISLMAKDATIFIIGAYTIIGMDFFTRHANEVNPATGTASVRAAKDQAAAAGYTLNGSDASDIQPAYT